DPGSRGVRIALRDERRERARLLSHLGEKAPTRLAGHQRAGPLSARWRRGTCPSGSASATWQATRRSVPIGPTFGVTAMHVSIAYRQRGWKRQPSVGLTTFGGSPTSAASETPSAARGSGTAESRSCVYGCFGR